MKDAFSAKLTAYLNRKFEAGEQPTYKQIQGRFSHENLVSLPYLHERLRKRTTVSVKKHHTSARRDWTVKPS
jgi:hypothetical protein